MAAMVSIPPSPAISPGEMVPTADERVVMHGVSWEGYESLLAIRGERSRPRLAYLDGAVELMGPSRGHEGVKKKLGALVEHYCTDRNIPITGYGSWTLKKELKKAGAEPDDCFVFSPEPTTKEWPDLVIEVDWTRGGINKLEIYGRLGIGEVWFWRLGAISIFALVDGTYVARERSQWVPELDPSIVARLVEVDPLTEAVRQLRDAHAG